MKCYCCNRDMKSDEIKFDDTYRGGIPPCGVCLLEISEVFNDGLDEEEITVALNDEWGDYLSTDSVNDTEENEVDENSS